MSDGPTPTEQGAPQNYSSIGRLYDERVQSGQLKRQHEDPRLSETRATLLKVLQDELYKPTDRKTLEIVELGCGVGHNTRDLLVADPYFQDTSRLLNLTGIDLSEESLKEYAEEVAKVRGNMNVRTKRNTIGDAVQGIELAIDNVMSTGVFQLPPEELKKTLETLLPMLVKDGAFLYQFMPPQQGETPNGDEPIQTKGLGDYYSYRYTKPYLEKVVGEIAQKKGFPVEVKFVELPEVQMPHPLHPETLVTNQTSILVVHIK